MSNMEKPDDRNPQRTHTSSRPRIDLGDGVRALSRDPRSKHAEESEHHNEHQLCNMDPENGDD